MSILIAIDDGHGMGTPGKRSPLMEDGSFMKENAFNKAVATELEEHLTRCGFLTLLVAPNDDDVPLNIRTTTANNEKAALYISIHANAYGKGEWNKVRGIETFHFPGSVKGKSVAETLHRHLLTGTSLPNRGVKAENFYVLRETNMPAVLVECGFMTNKQDAELLTSPSYRSECAEELARGICEIYNVPYVKEKSHRKADEVNIIIIGKQLEQLGTLKEGTTYVPLRAIAEALDMNVGWDGDSFTVNINN